MQFLRRDVPGPQGEPVGTWTATPAEIDEITIRKWGQVFYGNVTNLAGCVFDFFCKYAAFLYWKPEFKLEPVCPHTLMQLILDAEETTGGLDGWQLEDLKLLNLTAFVWLAKMYDSIEHGANWPNAAQHARAAYLVKDYQKLDDPLSYRGLLIMALVYRHYATLRLGSMHDWIKGWATDSMFAGVPGAGAEDAAWLTALGMEHNAVHNIPVSGGGADIRKCFDAIIRQLVYFLLWIAGCPRGVITAYRNMMERMIVYNMLTSGLGKPHKRRCGIPQGCPFSMMIMALLMRPWIMVMATFSVNPRVLADDVFCVHKVNGMLKASRRLTQCNTLRT